MRKIHYSMAVALGCSVVVLSLYMIGILAALPLPVSGESIVLYSRMLIVIPTVMSAFLGGCVLHVIGASRSGPILAAYASAVTMFLIVMNPWGFTDGVFSPFLVYWRTYIELLALPLAALALFKLTGGASRG